MMNSLHRYRIVELSVFRFLLIALLVIIQLLKIAVAQDSIIQAMEPVDFVDSATAAIPVIADTQYLHQQAMLQEQYVQQSIEQHSFNTETWKKATQGLDYTDKRTKEPDKEKKEPSVTPVFNISQQTLRVIALVILFAVLLIILLRAFGVNIFLGRKKTKTEKIFSAEEFDEDFPETELDRLLREAIERNDFRLAVRIYYLMAMKELTNKKLILWRKEKTNFDYVLELRETAQYKSFREVTLLFERVWYGEFPVSEQRFLELSERFKNFLTTLKTLS
ncbi:MAG: DUF4129 domain-containing protein [Chitinophagaceae bacterium]|nr:DUF4129 domain-containing protein [Chitinophagaceae bacterium]